MATNGECFVMVTGIDKDHSDNFHILAGHNWLTDTELAEWVKVEK